MEKWGLWAKTFTSPRTNNPCIRGRSGGRWLPRQGGGWRGWGGGQSVRATAGCPVSCSLRRFIHIRLGESCEKDQGELFTRADAVLSIDGLHLVGHRPDAGATLVGDLALGLSG